MGNCCSDANPAAAAAAPATAAPRSAAAVPGMDDYIDGLVAATESRDPQADAAELMEAKLTDDFSFKGMRFLAKVVDFYDGDTVRVVFRFQGGLIQYRVRMAGYDSPEMKPPKAKPNRDAEIAAAHAARAALIAKVANDLVYIECGPFDKYGRLLVTMYKRNGTKNGESLNEWMVANRHGVPYDGGKKTQFEED